MNRKPSITNADDAKLIELIGSARKRVLFLGPGVSDAVAGALADAWTRIGAASVDVILDVDPEVCRLGYGTLEALQILRDAGARAGTLVCQQPGVRIGLLIADDTTLIFSPTPLLIEAGSTEPNRPNAIQLGTPPPDLSRDVGLGDEPAKDRVVGLDPVQPQKIEAVAQDLAQNPPVKFDLARRVRVFTSRFQFVELEMTGCFVSRKRVRIPANLMGLARNPDVEAQFQAHFNLVSRGKLKVETRRQRVITEDSLQKLRQRIVKDFLIALTGYGMVVLRANKEKLLKAARRLRASVKVFQKGVTKNLQKQIDESVKSLTDALHPAVKQNPPEPYTKLHGPHVPEAELRRMLEEDIRKAFGKAETMVLQMKVSLVFKDLAYESLVDEDFLTVARAAMPGVQFLHEEYDAARTAEAEGATA